MHCTIHGFNRREHMKQLELCQRIVMVEIIVRCFLEWVRVDYRSAILNVDVHKRGDAAVIGNKQHQQKAF